MSWTHTPPPPAPAPGDILCEAWGAGGEGCTRCGAAAARQSPTLGIRTPGPPCHLRPAPHCSRPLLPSVPVREGLEVDKEVQVSGSQDPQGLPLSRSGPLFPHLPSGVTWAPSLGGDLACRAGKSGILLLALRWPSLRSVLPALPPLPRGDLSLIPSPPSAVVLNQPPRPAADPEATEAFCAHLSARPLAAPASPQPHPSTSSA